MAAKYVTAYYSDVECFIVPKCTRTTVHITCTLTKLVQELQVTRKNDDYVEARMKEFGGCRLRIRISLKTRIVTLITPDYSWLPAPKDVPIIVANSMAKMLNMRKSRKSLLLERNEVAFGD